MRFLLLSLDAAGNWPPERELVRGLVERGHSVHVVTAEVHRDDVEACGATYEAYRVVGLAPPPGGDDPIPPGVPESLVFAARSMLLNPQYAEELALAAARLVPDVLLVDQMLWPATAQAEALELPTAVMWHTIYAGWSTLRNLPPFMAEILSEQRTAMGLPALADVFAQAQRSAATLVFTLESFDAPLDRHPPTLHYVGPLACRPAPVPDAEARANPRPLVLVSFSTSFMDQAGVLQRVADALGQLPVRGLLTVGPAMDPNGLRLPANVTAETFVPHDRVLPEASLVITHAGHGTTMAAITAGVPLLCMPMGRDQYDVTARVEANGLGRSISQSAPAAEIAEAVAGLLSDAAMRDRVLSFAAGTDLESGYESALDVLEQLTNA